MELRNINTTGRGWLDGVYLYEVTAIVTTACGQPKREVLLISGLEACRTFEAKAKAYAEGEYSAEVFNVLNSIAQARAEGEG